MVTQYARASVNCTCSLRRQTLSRECLAPNQWLTSRAPNRERNYDLLRFAKLNISATDGLIEPFSWRQNISVVVP